MKLIFFKFVYFLQIFKKANPKKSDWITQISWVIQSEWWVLPIPICLNDYIF